MEDKKGNFEQATDRVERDSAGVHGKIMQMELDWVIPVSGTASPGAARSNTSTIPLPGHNTGQPGHPRVSVLLVQGRGA